MAKKNPSQVLLAKQGDNGSRYLRVRLTSAGESVGIGAGATAIINVRRADGEERSFVCEVNADGTITAPLTGWMLELDGMIYCDISIIDGDSRLTSTLFQVDVERAAYQGSDVSDDEHYDLLVSLIGDAKSASEDCQTAAHAAWTATMQTQAVLEKLSEFITDSKITDRLSALETTLADHLYEPIKIISAKITPSVVEKGVTVNSVRLDWELNHDPHHQTVDVLSQSGQIRLDGAARSYTFEAEGLEGDLFTLLAFENSPSGKSYADGAELRLSFYNGVYYGVCGEDIDMSALTKSLQGGRSKTFTANVGKGQYIRYACPESYGTPKFTVGGFDGGFELQSTSDYCNSYGYVEKYQVWRSVNDNLGSVTVVVS